MKEQPGAAVNETAAAITRSLQERGIEVAAGLEVDVDAYSIVGPLISLYTLLKSMAEGGPLREFNLSMTAFLALWTIWVQGEMEGNQVAAEVGIARSSFSELARRLEKRELLSRHEDPRDGRVVLFRVTDAGAAAVAEAWPQLNARMQVMASCLDTAEQRELADKLQRLSVQLERMEQQD